MKILLDTHSLLWYLTDYSKLSKTAEEKIDQSTTIFIPIIVILELLYLLKKKGLSRKFEAILKQIAKVHRYTIVSLDMITVSYLYEEFSNLEMHDGIIAASAKSLNVPLITKDPLIQAAYNQTIW